MSKLSFSITPSDQGYLIACNEIPYLFTDIAKIEEVYEKIRKLVAEYIEYFPYDAAKRGVNKGITIQVNWKAKPNSIALN